jgi:hypothetical protein
MTKLRFWAIALSLGSYKFRDLNLSQSLFKVCDEDAISPLWIGLASVARIIARHSGKIRKDLGKIFP